MNGTHRTSQAIFAALLSGVLIYGFAMGTSYPLLGIMLVGTVSDTWNGISVAATGGGLIIGVLTMPFVHRRFGAGVTAVLGVMIMAGALLALSLIESFSGIIIARMMLGAGANWMFVVTEISLNVLSDAKSRGKVFGLYSMLTGTGFVVGPAMVAFFPDQPTMLLLMCSGIAVLALLPFLSVGRILNQRIPAERQTRYLPSIRALPFAFVLLFIASAVDALAIGLLPVISMRSGFTAAQGAIFVTVFHIGLVSGQPLIGWLLDGWGRKKTILACILVSVAATGALAIGGASSFIVSNVLMFAWGAANYGLYTAGLTLLGDRFAGAALSAATGSFALVYAIAAIIAPPIAGFGLASWNAEGLYALIGCLYTAAYLWALYGFRPLEPVGQQQ